ncbi:MAG: hypothetical protein RSB96_00680, partial [Oscillospiraceae bacterium]
MAYFKGNSAYDLEGHEIQSNAIDKLELKLIKTSMRNKNRHNKSNSKFTFIVSGMVLAIIFSIYNREI